MSLSLSSELTLIDEAVLKMIGNSKKSLTSKPRANALPPPPREELERALKITSVNIEWLAGDGSDRCYYRLQSAELEQSYVLMQLSGHDAKALKSDGYDWVKIARLFEKRNIPVPRPVLTLPDYAALIIDDYGDTMLESVILELCSAHSKNEVLAWYDQCFDLIGKFLNIENDRRSVWTQRCFDKDKYSWELHFFISEFLEKAQQFNLTNKQLKIVESEIDQLSEYLSSFSHYFVHRDFHSRNVMVENNHLAILDFQDARLGSPAYDLVSLVFDNYVPFEQSFRLHLFNKGLEKIHKTANGQLVAEISEHWPAILLQRQLKAIGTYGYLTLTKKRGDYLRYVVPAMKTLTPDLIYSSRWPFLSSELLEKIKI